MAFGVFLGAAVALALVVGESAPEADGRLSPTGGMVTSVTAGTGLSGGGSGGPVTLSSDFTTTQKRVTGTCSAGSAVTAVASDGTVTCGGAGTGTVTSVATGTGLSGGPITSTGTINLALAGASCSAGSYVQSLSSTGTGGCVAEVGDISSVTAGTGLSGGGTTGAVTVALANTAVTPASYTAANITVDAQGRITAASNGTSATSNDYGFGVDGSLHYDSTTTVLGVTPSGGVYVLARDVTGATITIDSGASVYTNGYKFFASTMLTLNGTIEFDGAAGTSGNSGGAGGVIVGAGILGDGKAGGSGAFGSGAANNGGSTIDPYGAVSTGGNGGSGGYANAGSGGANNWAATNGIGISLPELLTAQIETPGATPSKYGGGAGGGGGAGSGAITHDTGGGGGAGGGVVWVAAAAMSCGAPGKLSAKGGAGGAGGTAIGGTGGGGGGGGGLIEVFTPGGIPGGCTTVVTGGAGGANGGGVGVDGSAGAAGFVFSVSP